MQPPIHYWGINFTVKYPSKKAIVFLDAISPKVLSTGITSSSDSSRLFYQSLSYRCVIFCLCPCILTRPSPERSVWGSL